MLSRNEKSVAYMCAEFGISNHLATYAGGLGVLAGDFVFTAGEDDFPLVGVGLYYKGKDFIQKIDYQGWQIDKDTDFDIDSSLLRTVEEQGRPVQISIPIDNGEVKIETYKARVGDRTLLLLLTTDIEDNPDEWKNALDELYWGDENTQIIQQIILGVGGFRMLKRLKISPSIYHLNEGRPGFVIWEIIREIMENEKISFNKAAKIAKKRVVYTNHTILKSGNLTYNPKNVKKHARVYSDLMGVKVNDLIDSGIDDEGKFCITQYALNNSKIASSVSKLHFKQSRKLWPGYKWVNITNGVNLGRWQHPYFRDSNISDEMLWKYHLKRKYEMMNTASLRTGFGYDPNRLVIAWARRIAGYKRPKLIFDDLERLKNIIKDTSRPVQLLIAGKAHTGDDYAKHIIQDIIRFMQNELSGHAIYVPNYDISLAIDLVRGVDVWLNTPEYGKEACGTSGMKASSNGVLSISIPDGWAYEVDWGGIGWALDKEESADSLYKILEEEVVPMYYKRDRNDLPFEWIERMKKSISLARDYSGKRMLEEYKKKLYI
jgi:starch phosphorylase